VKYWEIIADNLSASGWSWGCVSALDSNERTIFVADAHRDDGKRFIVRSDEKLTAFVELQTGRSAELSGIASEGETLNFGSVCCADIGSGIAMGRGRLDGLYYSRLSG
jgi:hypothetical protein